MLPRSLIKKFDKRRLRNLLALFFLALAIPTAVLIWQGYSQLKWEAFHQYRGSAEEMTGRIDARINDMIDTADAYSFADYAFLVVSGEPSAKFVQRSPLSAYPVAKGLPGILGYFQVDTQGVFSTPLLPPTGTAPNDFGIGEREFADRLQLAAEIQTILADNRLVQSRQDIGVRRRLAASQSAPGGLAEEREAEAKEQFGLAGEGYSQQVFDRLNLPRENGRTYADNDGSSGLDDSNVVVGAASQDEQRLDSIAKVSDLKLDIELQKKSEDVERDDAEERFRGVALSDAPSRGKRKEQSALPESALLGESDAINEQIANVAGSTDLRITTFESEIDPFEFSLVDGGHVVLFRKVWREGQRYIQGSLVEQKSFLSDIIESRFLGTDLADMSNLIVAHHNDVIQTFGGSRDSHYSNIADELDGALLYRSRLSAPLDSLELIFSIKRLPPGPGASVLAWVTLILAIVFAGGFIVLYRTGLSQIDLAEQQRDFVSAVSHELKSPLTSIRMYGEMLKEGWADEHKRQSYYEFIHEESERLSRLISNVLQLANITKNEPQFDLSRTNVGDLMTNTESKISTQIESAGFELNLNCESGADQTSIDIDEDCFAQIIINLVDNAIKFSKDAKNKTIEIGCKLSAESQLMFSVRDHGPGIPRDQMKKIFQLFYRTESELTRETVGTGIGLAIVHQLTMAMNGSVDMINAEPGAEFRVRFSISETGK